MAGQQVGQNAHDLTAGREKQFETHDMRQDRLEDERFKENAGVLPSKPVLGPLPDTLPDGTPVERVQLEERKVIGFTRADIAEITRRGEYPKYRDQILEAQRLGLLEDDITPPEVLEARRKATERLHGELSKNDQLIVMPSLIKRAEAESAAALKAYEEAQSEHDAKFAENGISSDVRVRQAVFAIVLERKAEWEAASAKLRDLNAQYKDLRLNRKPQEVQ